MEGSTDSYYFLASHMHVMLLRQFAWSKHQRNYNVTRKELLAFVTFAKKFRQYLLGSRFLVRTDHAALQRLKKTPEPIGQQARWLQTLEEFQ